VDGSTRGEDLYLATREDIFLATREDPELATREDFYMAMDSASVRRRLPRRCSRPGDLVANLHGHHDEHLAASVAGTNATIERLEEARAAADYARLVGPGEIVAVKGRATCRSRCSGRTSPSAAGAGPKVSARLPSVGGRPVRARLLPAGPQPQSRRRRSAVEPDELARRRCALHRG
jgi:hypothetical protein